MSSVEVIAAEVLGVLVPRLKTEDKPTISYGELSRQIEEKYGDHVHHWHGFSGALDLIQKESAAMGFPSLSVLVVRKGEEKPGQGWYTSFDNWYPELAGLDEEEKFEWLKTRIMGWPDWRPLLERFGVDLPESEAVKESVSDPSLFFEGASAQAEIIRSEVKRDKEARVRCLETWGTKCVICGFDSNEIYGVPGIIDVHHLKPIHEGERMTDPTKDLVPVCPTCHRIIHSKPDGGIYSLEEMREMLVRDRP